MIIPIYAGEGLMQPACHINPRSVRDIYPVTQHGVNVHLTVKARKAFNAHTSCGGSYCDAPLAFSFF